jgi:hypothetical protein
MFIAKILALHKALNVPAWTRLTKAVAPVFKPTSAFVFTK